MINSLEILTRSVSEEILRKQASLTLFEVALFSIEIEFEHVDYGVKRDSQSTLSLRESRALRPGEGPPRPRAPPGIGGLRPTLPKREGDEKRAKTHAPAHKTRTLSGGMLLIVISLCPRIKN